MAESVLSVVLPLLIEKLVSETSNSIARYKGIDAEIEKCHDSLKLIQRVLADASRKGITDDAVKGWLNDLQHLAYDIDDVLDGWATEAMHREFSHDSEGMTSKVRKLTPSCCTNFSPTIKMHDKLDRINAKLERLVKQRDDFGLTVGGETKPKNNNRRFQSSVVDPSSIVGRQAEKEALVQQLLLPAEEPCDRNYSIVPILGMGGVGKTTLARLLYNEEQVKDHFEVKAWVCVSDEFDSFRISKEIFQSMAKKEISDFNELQEALRDHLTGKRFLLVLDDVWSERREDWETLVRPFYTCAPGSKIIVTTRKDKLLKILGYNPLNKQLESLSYDDALSLFAVHALGVRNFDSHLSLKPHGEGIVKKCNGLPLALIALGTSLRTKEDEDSWKEVLESEIWKLPVEDEIIPALRLSYHDLSGPLKQLFAYCSLFPKDFLFDKKELVLLWMAEGFLHHPTPSDSTEEYLGHEFFDELLSRSFFQHAPNSDSLFVMHDLMNDLATSVSTEVFLRLDNENEKNIRKGMLEKRRHMSFVQEKYVAYKKFEAFERAKCLRTFLATYVGEVESWRHFYLSNKILADLLPELPLLRVLSLSGFKISEVPESIGTLRHLRYLNLSRTCINHLPETVGNLYNLQTLILFGCNNLTKLPNSFRKLTNLRHLDVKDTPLLFQMLLEIGKMKSLNITLSEINIESESGSEIAKLKDFKNLYEKFSVVGLEKVQNATYAHEANFSQKKLFGTGQAFPSLEILSFDDMRGWEKWSGAVFPRLQKLEIKNCPNLVEATLEALPSLNVLDIYGCPNLVEVTFGALPSMNDLRINKCDSVVLRSLVEVASAVTKLDITEISGLNDEVWGGVIEYLGAVEKLSIRVCNEIRYLVKSDAAASNILVTLRKLEVWHCANLVSIGEKQEEEDNCRSNILTSLKTLEVSFCKNMNCCSCPDGIEELTVEYCSSMTVVSFPKGGQEKLRSLRIGNCRKLLEKEWEWGGQKMNNNRSSSSMPMLEHVTIYNWPNLKSIIELNCWVHLTNLFIANCESLESFPNNLTSLEKLEIRNCPKLDVCENLTSLEESWVWPSNLHSLTIGKLKKPFSEWGPQTFPTSLVELKLYVDDDDGARSSSEFSHLLPSSLTSLQIIGFEKLKSVIMGLQHLTSLQRLSFSKCRNLKKVSSQPQHLPSLHHLSFSNCPKMKDLPEMLLPSLLSLNIWLGDYPEGLKERCSKKGSYWPLISHIPCLDI
ncbi:putative virus X resistance protein-like, coiled-coil [Helianthus annuus]|nr:putative virus X resistance protein-like, coiled-coil [Helianthus annuus]